MGRKEKYELDIVCAYCERATVLAGGEHVLCEKRGVVTGTYHCRKFVYDPLKRVPKRAKPLPEVELDALDDGTSALKATEEIKQEDIAQSETDTESESLSDVLPQLELPEVNDIP